MSGISFCNIQSIYFLRYKMKRITYNSTFTVGPVRKLIAIIRCGCGSFRNSGSRSKTFLFGSNLTITFSYIIYGDLLFFFKDSIISCFYVNTVNFFRDKCKSSSYNITFLIYPFVELITCRRYCPGTSSFFRYRC